MIVIKVNEPVTGTSVKTEVENDEHVQIMRLGRRSEASSGSSTVGTTPTLVLFANAGRVELVICNDSDVIVYLGFREEQTDVNSGIRLNPNGGTFTTVNYSGNVYAIAEEADANVTYAEIGPPAV